MKKRILSTILALCMIVALLPAIPEVAAADPITYTYNFVGLRDNAVSVKDVKYSETGNTWEFGDSNIGTVRAHRVGIEANASAVGHYVAIKVKIPTSGTFGVSFKHGRSTTLAGYGDVYFLPGDTASIETAIGSATPIGKNIGYYDASSGTQTTVNLSDIVVPEGKEGEYIFVFRATEKGASNYRMYMSEIVLTEKEASTGGNEGGNETPVTGPFVYELNYNKNVASDKVNIGSTYSDYSTTGNTWMWAGASSGVSAVSYNYNRSWVGNDDADRLYQQISGGYTYGIQIKTTAAGAWAAIKIKTPASGRYDVSLKYGRHNTNGGYGNVYILPVSTTSDIQTALDGATPINRSPISYDSSSAGESAEGTAYADRIAQLGTFTVAENETEHYLVFVACDGSGVSKYQMFPQSVTLTENTSTEPETPEVIYSDYKVTYDFKDAEADARNTTYASTDNFWKYFGASENFETTENSFKGRSYGVQIQKLDSGKWGAFALNVPVKGTYKLILDHTTSSGGGVAQWYIMPSDADISEGLSNDKYKLSDTIDFYSEETSTSTTELGDYTFENIGEYILVLTYVGNSPNYTGTAARMAQYPTMLTLSGGDKVAPMTLSGSIEGDIPVEDYLPITITATMSDKSKGEVKLKDIVFKSLDKDIATVDASGNVTGVSEGETTITFETKDGFAKGSVAVEVISGGEPQTFFAYDFNEGLTTGTKINTVTEYGAARGFWKFDSYDGESVASSTIHKWGMELRTHKLGDWVALRIKVTTPGRYFATLTHAQSATLGGYGNVYILPKNTENISEALKTATPIGKDISYYGAANTEIVIDELSAIDLTRGEHILVFEASKKGPSNSRQYPGLLELDSSNIFRTLEFDVDKTEYNIYADGTSDKGKADFSAYLLDGSEIPEDELTVVYGSEDDTVAECFGGEVIATGHGKTDVYVTVTHNGKTLTKKKEITVTDASGIKEVSVSADEVNFKGEKVKLTSTLVFNSGKSIEVSPSDTTYEIVGDKGEIVDGNYVTFADAGTVAVKATAIFGGETYVSEPYEVNFREPTTKRGPTYYTYERREAARENIQKYQWAKDLRDEAIRGADSRLDTYEKLYDMMPGEGIPRSSRVGAEGDPDYIYCRYCGNDNLSEYGSRGSGVYETNIYARPWKVQCPDCKRFFPSNDFALLYERGLDEHGYYDRDRAVAANAEAVANGEKDALHNDLYPELYDPQSPSYNKDPMTGDAIDGEKWGVDDGLGYLPGRTYPNGVEERHGYIAFYTHNLWIDVRNAIREFGLAYVYTDDIKYGRAGAVLVDRVADLYPSFSYKQWDEKYLVAHGGSGYGKIYGRINDNTYATAFMEYADAFYPVYNDPQVVSFLSEKAIKYNLENSKTSGEKIWANIEDGLLRDVFKSAKEGNIYGNYGQLQGTLAMMALVLDSEPESSQVVDWIYQPGKWSQDSKTNTAKCTGGNLSVQLVDVVDRDGSGNEASPRYNSSWIEQLYGCADILSMYSKDPKYDLYQNPKYAKMFTTFIPMVLVDSFTVQIGDTGATASLDYQDSIDCLIRGFMGLKDSPLGAELAEYLYRRNGYTEKGLHYDIFTKDPENMEKDILARLDGDISVPSEMQTGAGFAVLRAGGKYGNTVSSTYTNTLRDFWIYFGRNQGHGHLDTLNLGLEAFGLNFAPDNGYPEVASTDPHRYQWMEATIAHNTVTVNEKSQKDNGPHGFPKHFDDSGEVKIMDIDSPAAYAETQIYRRTLVMINAGDNVSYGVDFFRVKGGNDHIYSFHSQSNEIFETEGLGEIKYQTDDGTKDGNFIGTYASPDVEYGPDPANTYVVADLKYPQGYTWLKNVRRSENVGNFSVDFKVEDFQGAIKDKTGLHLRMTMLNDFALDEVALTSGNVPNKSENKKLPRTFEYVLARRKGENLDSLYTTVYEPYRNERYIESMSALEIKAKEGEAGANDVAKAIKVIRTDGRIDYIMYATDNTVLYTVTDGEREIAFRGFAGVYSINCDGEKIYAYVHDGDVIGEEKDIRSEIKGIVKDFTRDLALENSIFIKTDDEVNAEALSDKYVFIENDGVQNGVYRIHSAEKTEDGIKLNIGAVSLIRSYRNENDTSLGFIYNIAKGQLASIPLSYVNDGSPVFEPISDGLTATAESTVKLNVRASCEDESKITYVGDTLPSGASIDSESGEITWKPTSAQIGDNHFAIRATDGKGKETTIHFTVRVYGKTSGGTGNGATPSVKPEDKPEVKPENEPEIKPENPVTPDKSARFVDLGAYPWAEDAINTLADKGIIKGTSETTFSPGKNITRADFAILLVRAFEKTSDNAENFSDVSENDYFAKELAIARNTGLVGGIGDNKFAPRENIKRCDMMLMVYRVLKDTEAFVGRATPGTPDYPDFDSVPEYARDAVSALIGAGLVNGKGDKIAPNDNTTRAEVAVLLQRVLDFVSEK